MSDLHTPQWQPISALAMMAEAIDGMLESAEAVYQSLQQARPRPHVLDDDTVGRVRQAHSTQLDDLWLYEEQLERWQKSSPTPEQRAELDRLIQQLIELRQVLTSSLVLTDELKEGTIEKVLAKDDMELALEFLLGKRRP